MNLMFKGSHVNSVNTPNMPISAYNSEGVAACSPGLRGVTGLYPGYERPQKISLSSSARPTFGEERVGERRFLESRDWYLRNLNHTPSPHYDALGIFSHLRNIPTKAAP
jgi:hypothetical protein